MKTNHYQTKGRVRVTREPEKKPTPRNRPGGTMSRSYNMVGRFLCLSRLFSEDFLDQSIQGSLKVRGYFDSQSRSGVSRDSLKSTVLVHLFRGYLGEVFCCIPYKEACDCKDWDDVFRTIMQNGMAEFKPGEGFPRVEYASIDNFTRNFSAPIEGIEGDLSGMTSFQEHRQHRIPSTHLLNRPFMIERGLDVHPSASPAWLGGNCNELTSLYSALTDGKPATESHKLFEQFVKQLHCIPFVQSQEGNELKITPIWSESVKPADCDKISKTWTQ